MLSELERLAAMVQDSGRVREIGPDQWPLAMIACGLVRSNDPDRLPELLDIYDIFSEVTPLSGRASSLNQLCKFITLRKGEGWRSLLPYALKDPDAQLRRKAAEQVILLAPPSENQRFTGAAALVELLSGRKALVPATLLDALLGLSDMRFLPVLQPLCSLSSASISGWLKELQVAPNHLSCNWLLMLADAQPELAQEVLSALLAMPSRANLVLDVVLPVPTWAFTKPAPQPLHGWSLPEYAARMLPSLRKQLPEPALSSLCSAWQG